MMHNDYFLSMQYIEERHQALRDEAENDRLAQYVRTQDTTHYSLQSRIMIFLGQRLVRLGCKLQQHCDEVSLLTKPKRQPYDVSFATTIKRSS